MAVPGWKQGLIDLDALNRQLEEQGQEDPINPKTKAPQTPAQAFQRTLAPERRTNMPNFGKGVIDADQSNMFARAGAGDMFALKHLIDQDRQLAIARANEAKAPMGAEGEGMRQAFADRAERSLMGLMGLGEEKFKSDTDRSKAGIAEFEQKVTMPERNEAMLEQERGRVEGMLEQEKMRGANELAKAEISRKMALEAPFINQIALASADKTAPPGTAAAIADRLRDTHDLLRMRDGSAAGAGTAPVSTGDPTLDSIIRHSGGRGAPAPQAGPVAPSPLPRTREEMVQQIKEKEKKEIEAREAKRKQDVLAEQTLGLTVDPKTGLYVGGKFDPANIAAKLAESNATPEQIEALAQAFAKGNFGKRDETTAQMFNRLRELYGASGQTRGVGSGFTVGVGDGFPFAPAKIEHPDIGSISLSATPGSFLRGIPNITQAGREKSLAQAKAMDAFLQSLMKQYKSEQKGGQK